MKGWYCIAIIFQFLILHQINGIDEGPFRCYYCEDCLREHGGALIECAEVYSVPTKGDLKRGDAKLACEKFGRRKRCVLVDENFPEGCLNPYEDGKHPWLGNQSGFRDKEGRLDPAVCYCTLSGCNNSTKILPFFLTYSVLFSFLILLIYNMRM